MNSAVRFLYQLKRVLAIAGLGVAFTGCVGELHHARQPKPLLAPRPRFAEFTHPPRLAREQLVGLAGFVGEGDFSQSSALMELLTENGVGSARSCSLGCTVVVRRDNAAAAAAIVAADGRFEENLLPEFRLPLASGPR